jgi:glycosyltransferase involved in cell wall biosynthesis
VGPPAANVRSSTMPTLLFISPVAEAGGSDQALLRIIRSLRRDEFVAHVVVPDQSPLEAPFRATGATVHVIPMRRITTGGGPSWWVRYVLEWPISVVRLVRLIRRLRADVVVSNSLHSWYGWAAAWLTRRPHVWHAREIVVQSTAALRLERTLVGRFADLLIACSSAAAEQFAGAVPAERLLVVHEDVDRSDFHPGRAAGFRRARGIADDVPVAGFVGRFDTWKGIDVLLTAWPAVRRAMPSARLVVVGGPVRGKESFAQALQTKAADLPGIDWVGSLPSVADVMADLDVLVAPSTQPEPYGLVLVEALASGSRVVTTNAGGPPEIVARAVKQAGVLVPPADATALADAIIGVLREVQEDRRRGVPRTALIEPFPADWPAVFRRVTRKASVSRNEGDRGA